MTFKHVLFLVATVAVIGSFTSRVQADDTAILAAEVRDKGWLVYSARAENGSWDVFRCRPDGSDVRNLTETARFEEAAPRVSPDGERLIYRRLERGAVIDHDKWGFSGEVIIANADASSPKLLGAPGEYPWAAWMPDSRHISCLYPGGIAIVNVDTGSVMERLPRQGIFQQLFPAPNGRRFCGTGNFGGPAWSIIHINVETGRSNAVQRVQCCTPDWFPDSERVIYSSRPDGQQAQGGYGATHLRMANRFGTNQRMIYGDEGFHIYGGLVSPDGKYVVFSKSRVDGGGSEKEGAPMYLMRLADAPIIEGESPEMREAYPFAKDGPLLSLPDGWEPHWTPAPIGVPSR